MKFQSTYHYFDASDKEFRRDYRTIRNARTLGWARLNPRFGDPDFLILRARRRHFAKWLQELSGPLRVLDVGGRVQPYRPLIDDRVEYYVAIDPQPTGVHDIIGVGEQLPFASESFDLVICAQVLSYVSDPQHVADEMFRVLRPGGLLMLSVPAFFPWHHDERWRLLPDGLRILLSKFSKVEIVAEGHSVAGCCRTLNVMWNIMLPGKIGRAIIQHSVIPVSNLIGICLDPLSGDNDQFTANNSVRARK